MRVAWGESEARSGGRTRTTQGQLDRAPDAHVDEARRGGRRGGARPGEAGAAVAADAPADSESLVAPRAEVAPLIVVVEVDVQAHHVVLPVDEVLQGGGQRGPQAGLRAAAGEAARAAEAAAASGARRVVGAILARHTAEDVGVDPRLRELLVADGAREAHEKQGM